LTDICTSNALTSIHERIDKKKKMHINKSVPYYNKCPHMVLSVPIYIYAVCMPYRIPSDEYIVQTIMRYTTETAADHIIVIVIIVMYI
jgi:hypothetical protein